MAFEATVRLPNLGKTHAPLCQCYSKNEGHIWYHSHWSKLVKICEGLHRQGRLYLVHYDMESEDQVAYIYAE
jgi:hypothetical protein